MFLAVPERASERPQGWSRPMGKQLVSLPSLPLHLYDPVISSVAILTQTTFKGFGRGPRVCEVMGRSLVSMSDIGVGSLPQPLLPMFFTSVQLRVGEIGI